MSVRWLTLWSGLAGLFALALVVFLPEGALAQCCAPPSPPCCSPPCCKPPKPPPPPAQPCCGSGGHQIKVPGVNVVVGASVVVNAAASANVNAAASGAGSVIVYGGGGGSSFSMGGGSVSVIQGLNVEGGARLQRTAYNASRTRVKVVVIQAFCLDDRDVPHPASQVTPDRDIDETYQGELYRCLAGTRMQYTVSDYAGKIAFDHGQTFTCAKGEALTFSRWNGPSGPDAGPDAGRAGRLECRPQKPARDCNERSLLRRFGAGVKILRIITTETYTAYREETVQGSQVSSFNMSVDGGVGGVAY